LSDDEPDTQSNRRRAILRQPRFRLLLTARAISFFGDSLAPIALPFAVLGIGGDVGDVGLVLGAGAITNLVLLLVGGVVADRFPRRLLLVTSDLVQGTAIAVTALLLLTDAASVWSLALLQVAFGAGMAINLPAFTGIVPQLVARPDIQTANGLLSVTQSTAQIAGPSVAGILVAVASPGLALAVDASTFLVSALLLARLSVDKAVAADHPRFFRGLVEGWTELLKRRWYWVSLLAHSGANFSIGVFYVLGPAILADAGAGASGWGLVATAGSVGSVLGGLAILRWRLKRPLVIANVALTLYAPVLLLLAIPAPVWALMIAAAVATFSVSVLNGAFESTMQKLVPDEILARLDSYDWLISFAVLPLGYALAGPLSEAMGRGPLLVVSALILVVPCTLTLLDPHIRGVRTLRSGEVVLDLR
jgi:MFS family permease